MKDNEGKKEKIQISKSVQILKDYSYNLNMVNQEIIAAFQWIELSIKNEDKKVGTFVYHDQKGK